MNKTELARLVNRVHAFILDAYDEAELAQLVYYTFDATDLSSVVKSSKLEQVVFELVIWSLRQGGQHFRRLTAAAVTGRREVVTGADLLRDVEALVAGGPAVPAAGGAGPSG